MKRLRKLIVLALAVCMVWCMSATVFAASSDASGETSTFTFTNEGAASGETLGEQDQAAEDQDIGGSGGTTDAGSTGSSSGSSTNSVKTADASGVAVYSATAAACLAAILGVSVSRRRRYGKEER